jgi:hypothetical protein
MRFPDSALYALLDRDAPIVAANYVQRTMPEWWVARLKGHPLSSIGHEGIEAVDSVGCGLMLIRLSVFENLPRPWFPMPYDGQTHLGEDLGFCRNARAAGFEVWIDHDLSHMVRHQGTVELGAYQQEPANLLHSQRTLA